MANPRDRKSPSAGGTATQADTALRLGKFFKTGAAFWMNIQARFDLGYETLRVNL